MEVTLDQGIIAKKLLINTNELFGKRIGFVATVFGCQHKELSRPFTDTNINASYRACLNCGARKKFDTIRMKTIGPFYYPPTISFDNE